MDSVTPTSDYDDLGRAPRNQLRRLLHIEASGAQILIHQEMVMHVGQFAELTPAKRGNLVLDRVAAFNGDVIPVIDIRDAPRPCSAPVTDVKYRDLLVIALNGQLVGIRVEKVIDLVFVSPAHIEPLRTRLRDPAEFVVAMVSLPQQRLPLVDLKRLLCPRLVPVGRARH